MKHNVAEFMLSTADGGAETIVKDYMLMIDKEKFNVCLIVRRRYKDAVNDKILLNNNAKIISIYNSNSFLMKIIQKLNDWWYIPYRLKKILNQEDIKILHNHLNTLYYSKKISNHIKEIRLFYTCHSDPKKLHLSVKKERKAAEYLIKNNDLQMIALHDDMRKEINQMFEISNTVVIRNGINFTRFRNIPESKMQIRTTLNIPQNAFVIGHVGRFVDVKNHIFLADIFIELCKRKNNSFLLMIGEGALKEKIEEKLNKHGLKDRYMILSHRTDIPQLMKAMDIFVFPSKYEGLPVTLVEAQVSGLRCVISDTINEESILSENTVPVSLSKKPSEWCDVILDEELKGTPHGNIDDYDMNKEIKKLEKLYLGESYDE